jgi:serine/threonine protein kinase
VNVAVVDDALGSCAAWDTGLAHRDVKPANLMTKGDQVAVIDVGFAGAPHRGRQAIDLANMMLALAAHHPELVYERALLLFTEDDIAEAFAATHSITVPTQLRQHLKADGRDLVAAFRALAPPRPPIRIQRWSARRIGLAVVVAGGGLLLVLLVIATSRRQD